MKSTTLRIDGMSCGHCVASVADALKKVEGVRVNEVALGRAEVVLEEPASGLADVTAAIQNAGYRVVSATD